MNMATMSDEVTSDATSTWTTLDTPKDPTPSTAVEQGDDATTTTTITTNDNKDKKSFNSSPKKDKKETIHKFAAGDHVIRWEMLPIAWPIQIHGIILNVSEECVVLVDFGLTASEKPTENENVRAAAAAAEAEAEAAAAVSKGGAEEGANPNSDPKTKSKSRRMSSLFFSSDPKEMESAIQKSFQKLYPKREKQKQRLNVLVLDDVTEISKWKKVNYDKSLFGFGGPNNNESGHGDGGGGEEGENGNENGKKKKWWKSFSKNSTGSSSSSSRLTNKRPSGGDGDGDGDDDEETITTQDGSSELVTNTNARNIGDDDSKTPAASWLWKKMSMKDVTTSLQDSAITEEEQQEQQQPDNENAQREPWWKMVSDENKNGNDETQATTTTTTEEEGETKAADFSKHTMNPAMAKLLQKEEEQDAAATTTTSTASASASATATSKRESLADRLFKPKKNHSIGGKSKAKGRGSTTDDDEEEDGEKKPPPKQQKKLNLPKADPPKLVLARTRWLLQHGEAILPPYHCFHSNSECIAVFCKTGYWSNLQADVFLHSTAIGNAKSMGMATLGVAASVPLLAPVIAGLGIGMVAAPWYILHSSKQIAEEATQTLTDSFWEQAEPEVFLECIEHWTKLDEYYAALAKRKEEQEQARAQIDKVKVEVKEESGEGETDATTTTTPTDIVSGVVVAAATPPPPSPTKKVVAV